MFSMVRTHFPLCFLGMVALVCAAPASAQTVSVVVNATDCVWLAGMPNGTTGIPYPGGVPGADTAPGQSPLLVTGLSFSGGNNMTFAATGTANWSPGPLFGPDGNAGLILPNGGTAAAYHGISRLKGPAAALIGVFLDDSQPDSSAAPSVLDFSTNASRNFTEFHPLLKQAFFIGDGLTSLGDVQRFYVPDGATRLFLGVNDYYQWTNNAGSFAVDVTVASPEPNSVGLALGVLPIMGLISRRLRKNKTR